LLLVAVTPSLSQTADKCYTELYNKQLSSRHNHAGEPDFETWLTNQIEQNIAQARKSIQVYRIPVVVHILHDGEPIGQGSNFSDAQVARQIEILNNDFRRRNVDTVNTPAIYKRVAVDTHIQFELASKDPDGIPTNGIVRKNGSHLGMTDELKTFSYWPAEDYMNVWVKDFHLRTGGFAGFAQFPLSTLPGLEDAKNERLTDGVVINAIHFGENSSTDNKGRTLVHETGHFLGLLHVWGKNSTGQDACQHDDFCKDTPSTDGPNDKCDFSKSRCNANEWQMPQNFMDYAKDACMNLFTRDQMTRMRTVLENSPRRASLLTSPALSLLPVTEPNEGELIAYPNPAAGELSFELGVSKKQVVQLEIIDLLGNVVLVKQLTAAPAITCKTDVSRLPSGIYLAKVQGSTFSAARRIVIRN
jgi:hypothetical protein